MNLECENKAGISKKLSELADMVEGEFEGHIDPVINGVGDPDNAVEGQLVLVSDPKRFPLFKDSKASAFIVPKTVADFDRPLIRAGNPVLALAIIHQHFVLDSFCSTGIHATAQIGENCRIPKHVSIGSGVILGNEVILGERVALKAGAVIGDRVIIGDDCVIHSNVTVYAESVIGDRVIIHAGTVVGSDGFGYAIDTATGRHVKRPHVGKVQIDDDVEIGANSCIDRGTFGTTLIKRGTKIDNLVQIAHNCQIGENCLLAGQSGMAGSVILGDNVTLAGQAAIKDHVSMGNGSIAAAKAGVISGVESGAVVAGMPAIPLGKWRKSSVAFKELPGLIREMRHLQNRVAELERLLGKPKLNEDV